MEPIENNVDTNTEATEATPVEETTATEPVETPVEEEVEGETI